MVYVSRGKNFSALACAALSIFIWSCNGGDEADLTRQSSSGAMTVQEAYFEQVVVPRFNAKNCQSCHNPFQAGRSIYDYATMQALLLNGPARTNNVLIRTVAGFVPHPQGGDQCGYIGGEPCATISNWWDREIANFSGGTGGGGTSCGAPQPVGFATYDYQTGLISGYAFDKCNSSTAVQVELYMDGPPGSGTQLGMTMTANNSRSSPPFNSGFTYQPISAYTDGRPHKLYAYVLHPSTGAKVLIQGKVLDYIAGTDTSGQAFFNANIRGQLVGCNQCHGGEWDNYYYARSRMGMPSPLDGGTATNNTFYLKINGALSHGGGNRCAGTLCQQLPGWYATDFGN